MTYTKKQLETMQAAGVTIQYRYDKDGWQGPAHVEILGITPFTDLSRFRPQPGFTFTGYIPRKLQDAGIALEEKWPTYWKPVDGGLRDHCEWIYRIAQPAAEPKIMTHGADIAQITKELDEALVALAWAQEESDRWQREMDAARKERDDAMAIVAKIRQGSRLLEEAMKEALSSACKAG